MESKTFGRVITAVIIFLVIIVVVMGMRNYFEKANQSLSNLGMERDPDKREQILFKGLKDYLESIDEKGNTDSCYAGSFEHLPQQLLTNVFYALIPEQGRGETINYFLYKYEHDSVGGQPKRITRTKIDLKAQGIRTFTVGVSPTNFVVNQEPPVIIFYHQDHYKHHSDSSTYVEVPPTPYIATPASPYYQNILPAGVTSYYYTHEQPRFYLVRDGEKMYLALEPPWDGYGATTNRDHLPTQIPDCR